MPPKKKQPARASKRKASDSESAEPDPKRGKKSGANEDQEVVEPSPSGTQGKAMKRPRAPAKAPKRGNKATASEAPKPTGPASKGGKGNEKNAIKAAEKAPKDGNGKGKGRQKNSEAATDQGEGSLNEDAALTPEQIEERRKEKERDDDATLEFEARQLGVLGNPRGLGDCGLFIDQYRLANPRYGDPEVTRRVLEKEAAAKKPKDPRETKLTRETQQKLRMQRTNDDEYPERIHIRVLRHGAFDKLYSKDDSWGIDTVDEIYGDAEHFQVKEDVTLPPEEEQGLDRETLMKCSEYAHWYFTFHTANVTGNLLPLPVKCPERYYEDTFQPAHPRPSFPEFDGFMGHVHPKPLRDCIIPWIQKMERLKGTHPNGKYAKRAKDLPTIEVPKDYGVGDKIHLYNAMLHLWVPNYFQRLIIEDLCKEIYTHKLTDCELELLEFTVGRFHARTVTVLDPVLCCLVGSYAEREPDDRGPYVVDNNDKGKRKEDEPPPSRKLKLEHEEKPIARSRANEPGRIFPDTLFVPAALPVLGHSIKNWSRGGVKPTSKHKGTYPGTGMGYPLHIGESKYYRRNHVDEWPIGLDVVEKCDLLKKVKHLKSRPGEHPGVHGERCA